MTILSKDSTKAATTTNTSLGIHGKKTQFPSTPHLTTLATKRTSNSGWQLHKPWDSHCPIVAPIAGCFFSNNGTQFDHYSTYLALAPPLGRRHTALHNQIQRLIQDMIKLSKIDSQMKAANFLINKMPQPYIGDYINHVTQHPGHPRNTRDAIVPDIHATN